MYFENISWDFIPLDESIRHLETILPSKIFNHVKW